MARSPTEAPIPSWQPTVPFVSSISTISITTDTSISSPLPITRTATGGLTFRFSGEVRPLPENGHRLPSDRAQATAAADLNHDGYIDLVVANAGSDPWRPIDSGETSYIYWGGKQGFSAGHRTGAADPERLLGGNRGPGC